MTFTRGFIQQGEDVCTGLQAASPVCCPADSFVAVSSESGGSSSPCPFCPSGLSADKASESPPQAPEATCTDLASYAATLGDGSSDCSNLQFLESFCCQAEDGGEVEDATKETTAEQDAVDETTAAEESAVADTSQQQESDAPAGGGEGAADPAGACGFCPGGVSPDAAGAEVPGSGGFTCSDLASFAQALGPGEDCDAVVLAAPLCCPGAGTDSVRNFFEALQADGN